MTAQAPPPNSSSSSSTPAHTSQAAGQASQTPSVEVVLLKLYPREGAWPPLQPAQAAPA